MSTTTTVPQPPAGAGPSSPLLTIGELAERTGLTPELLRTWEARHGFPVPTRLPSGHRRYTEDDVHAVRRVLADKERGVRLEQAIATALRSGEVGETGSVYAALAARHPTLPSYTLTKQTLIALSWAIEDEALASATRPVTVATFQRGRFFEGSRNRWTDLARTARAAVAMADFPAHDDAAEPALVALPPDSPLLREWILACDAPGLTAALVAWEFPGQEEVPDRERHFEALWSVDGPVVRDCGLLTTAIGADLGSHASATAHAVLEAAPAPGSPSPRAATAIFNRMVAYTDGTVLRSRTGR